MRHAVTGWLGRALLWAGIVVLVPACGGGGSGDGPARPSSTFAVSGELSGLVSNLTTTYASMGDGVTFTKAHADTQVELVLYSRIDGGTFAGGAIAAQFQLRIDGVPSPIETTGSIVGSGVIEFMALEAVFSGLAAGTHTVSIWGRVVPMGTSTGSALDPLTWGSRLIVRETAPPPAFENVYTASSDSLNDTDHNLTSTMSALGDYATFIKSDADSDVEVVLHSRVAGGIFGGGATGALFQLRVDGLVSPIETQGSILVSNGSDFLSITAVFSGLSTGSHTVSVWGRVDAGTSTGAALDPGAFGGRILIKEVAASPVSVHALSSAPNSLTASYSEMGTPTSFTKVRTASRVQVLMHSRFDVGTLGGSGTGVVLQLRVDGMPSTLESPGAVVPPDSPDFISVVAVFSGLPAGLRSLSVWGATNAGTATNATLDPGGWGGGIIVRELD